MTSPRPNLRRFLGMRSLRQKLQALTITLIALGVFGAAGTMLFMEASEKIDGSQKDGVAVGSMLAELSLFAIYTRSGAELEQVARIALLHPDLRYVEILDPQGKILLSRVKAGAPPQPFDGEFRTPPPGAAMTPWVASAPGHIELFRADDIELVAPVASRPLFAVESGFAAADAQNIIGYLRLGLNLNSVREELFEDMQVNLIGGLVLILIASLLTVMLTRRIVEPIEKLTGMADRIAGGELDASVDIATGDELQQLGESFNRMSASLRQSQRQIAEYQGGLEAMVSLRTEELQKAAAHAQQLAQRDLLTGLANRALLNSRLHTALALAERRGDKAAVLVVNLARFSAFNDTHGRDIGDDLLHAVAARLVSGVRDGDTVARADADEFVIVLGDIRAASVERDVVHRVEAIARIFEKPFDLDGRKFSVSAHIGAAIYPDDGSAARILLANARAAADKSRSLGGYRFHRSDLNERTAQNIQLEHGLRAAIARNEFVLRFEPVINLADNVVTRLEASMLWDHPLHGLMPAARYMKVAEDSGLHLPLCGALLRAACNHAAESGRQGAAQVPVAIRPSARQIQIGNLTGMVDAALRGAALKPSLLAICIPESVVADDLGAAVILVRELHAIGVRVLITEYGTGSSNLSDLAKLPIDAVVIDRSFARGLSNNPSDRAIVQAYIAMAHSLGVRLAADGVSAPDQLEFLSTHGCDEALGPVYGPPLSAEALRNLAEAQGDIPPSAGSPGR